MRVLMLAHRLPYPPHTGDKVRAYHVARHLAQSHDLTLACLSDEPDADGALQALRREIPDVEAVRIPRRFKRVSSLLHLLRGGSATVAYFDSAHLRTRLRTRGTDFDLVYVSSSSMTQYLPRATGVPVIIDFVDVDSDKWAQYGRRLPAHQAWVYRLEGARLRQHEAAAARQASHSLVATPQEAALLHSFAAWAPTTVIPNGVDLDYFRPAEQPAEDATIVFTGAMDYFPNCDAALHFCREMLPLIRSRIPEARFLIVGKNPSSAVRRLARVPGVHVTGTVPDVRPFLRRAAVAVAPLRVARGIQNKVLEAMAMGVPVVATGRAHEGLEAHPGRHLFVEDTPARFAAMVVRLLDTPGLRAAVGGAAREFVETHHSWPASMARLGDVVAHVTRRSASRTPLEVR
jgi:sugar transferase (PEP-CTERM/EpsH1 system associated)